ncbi:SHOCT domain-containing protein [Mycobacterium sherrisii]|uniref:SHOCT domain-containing protein n=1 Tax=Mycobacterium sherrisii TaxID=243061 RepID=UPI00114EA107|nr:SHOCT domain-containing protein [Mycobacterium sherrisii]MCV7031976.1 SHOCT domain-containing protein [Mycobacterium sherrisii]MEC4763977.1 SHOCT domain-containing protein [Mycobacterium sherrisii]
MWIQSTPGNGSAPPGAPSSGRFGGTPVLGNGPLLALPGRGAPEAAPRHPGVLAPAGGTAVDQGEWSSGRPCRRAVDMHEITDLLDKLGYLRDRGVLTDKEFVAQKQRLLGNQ